MFTFILNYLWNGIVGWIGIGGAIVIGLCVAAWFSPSVRLRQHLLWAALTIGVVIGAYAKGYHDEYAHLKGKWQQAEQNARKVGESARADAIRDVGRGVSDDPNDRDDY